jgi:hypothetical protein
LQVFVNGVDTRAPALPFTFVWGDGFSTTGFFPQYKTYSNCTQNYVAEVRPNYGSGPEPGAVFLVRFIPLSLIAN